MFLFTNGVTEAFNTQDEAYGEERLENYLDSHLTQPINELVKEIMQELNSFSMGRAQSDDITMLTIWYKR